MLSRSITPKRIQPYSILSLRHRLRPAVASHAIWQRPSTTTTKKEPSSNDANQILIVQRKNRPVSPHLGIYKWQITSVLSILNRITGGIFSIGFYGFGLAYAASAMAGWDMSSASMAAAFGSLPVAAKMIAKFVVAFPFAFHCFNGVRHLMWDTARQMTNGQVVRTGWIVVGLTTASAVATAMV